jgi:ribosomal protein S18 acetylase RimI-like enzyme
VSAGSGRRKATLEVRQASPADVPGIVALVDRAYDRLPGYSRGMVRGQINNYPEGQFVAVHEGRIVGYCASIRLDERLALAPHSWDEITNDGFGSRHDPTGDWLYGFEMCVDPEQRGVRMGQRLYDERKALAERIEVKGIVVGGRLPLYSRYRRKVEGPEDYVEQVKEGKLRDPTLGFQLKNGFEPIGILANYLPEDKASQGYAAHLVWRNPYVDPDEPPQFRVPRDVESVRLATCQLQMRAVKSFEEFIANIEYFVDVAADYRADFIVFPELLTLQLLAFEKRDLSPAEAIDRLTDHTPGITAELSRMALRYNINIIGGSHPTRTDDGDMEIV